MHLHGFCKVVTSETATPTAATSMHLHGFVRLIILDGSVDCRFKMNNKWKQNTYSKIV